MTDLASDTAMVMAAGLGKRMRPLTASQPKPLIRVNGKALIDYSLDGLAQAGVARAVVNLHYLADALEAHLTRRKQGPAITISDERDLLLEEPPARQACTMQYGGPEVATVAGTLDGDPVDATFSRQDGCAIARFDAAQALWLDEQPMDGPGGEVPPTAGEPEVVDDPPSAFDK